MPPTFRNRAELKSAIRDQFFGRPENLGDKDFSETQIEEIEKTSPSGFEGKKYLESFLETHTHLQYKEMWLQHQIDNERRPAQIARKYDLNSKTVGQWLREYLKLSSALAD